MRDRCTGILAAGNVECGVEFREVEVQAEKFLAGIAVAVHALLVLGVEARNQGDGNGTELLLALVEGVAHFQRTAQRAAGQQGFGQFDAGPFVADREFAGIGLALDGFQLECLGTQNQRLAVAHENVDGAIVQRDRGGTDVLVELGQGLVTLVQEVVGRIGAPLPELGNLVVEGGDLLGQPVDRGDARADFGIDAGAQVFMPDVHRLEGVYQCSGLVDHGLAGRDG